ITGGGLLENIPRVMPEYTKAVIDGKSWTPAPIFQWLQKNGNIKPSEMHRTFNCGIGMVLCVAEADVEAAITALTAQGEQVFRIGTIEAHTEQEPVVIVTE